jgi:hypothetical protein
MPISFLNTNNGGSFSAIPNPPPYFIGQAALGGKIAYILQPSDPGYVAGEQHGLVAATADISTSVFVWGCNGTNIPGAMGIDIGTGNQNTIDIMAGCATPNIAARLCGDLVEGGYSDWYLPSRIELTQLYNNRVAIGGFNLSTFYWSSTEVDANNAITYAFNFATYFQAAKTFALLVRAVRSF